MANEKSTGSMVQLDRDALAAVLSSIRVNLAVLDDNGNIVFVNEPWKRFWGENAGDNPDRNWIGVNYLDSLEHEAGGAVAAIVDGIGSVIQGRSPAYSAEYPCHSPDQQRWFLMTVTRLSGYQNLVVIAHMDITDRKLDEQKLNSSEEHFRRSQIYANIGSWEFDFRDRKLHLSENVGSVFGLDAETREARYVDFLRFVHEDDRYTVDRALRSCVIEGKKYNIDHRIRLEDGSIRWLHESGDVLRDESGLPVKMYGMVHDITAFHEAEEKLIEEKNQQQELIRQLHKAQSQLLQSEKMASIGHLAAGVAHEINNPVGYINSNIGSLKKYLDDLFQVLGLYEKAEQHIADAAVCRELEELKARIDLQYIKEDLWSLLKESEEGVNRVKQIVSDLKDFSHVDEAEWQVVDIHKGLDATLNVVWNELKYRADVIREYGEIPYVECMPSKLNQVFMNILVNAAHAIENHGSITIRTGADNDDWVWIEIKDTGKGMPENMLGQIFEPFFTTKPVGQGTGLGLSLSWSIVNEHGGNISVDSRPGEGAIFKIMLPVRKED
jgi:PAS domain S-box-containing protein